MEINLKELKKVKKNSNKIAKKKKEYDEIVSSLSPEVEEFCQIAEKMFFEKIFDSFVDPRYKDFNAEKCSLTFKFEDDCVRLRYDKVYKVDLEGFHTSSIFYYVPLEDFVEGLNSENVKATVRKFKMYKKGRCN